MTSGTFATFPVASIWVNREKRQRRDINVDDLLVSIPLVGLIHPPVIRKDGELIVGERRWTAIQQLGWTDVPVQFIEDLSEEDLHLVELEENTRRKDISWQENVKAVSDYHSMRKQRDEAWTITKTAESLGLSQPTISQMLMVKEELDSGNKLVVEAPKFSVARNVTIRKQERKAAAIIESVPVIAAEEPKPVKPEVPLLNVDFHKWASSYAGPKFNFIHCDFPYGVGMDKSDQGSGKAFGTYADGENVYWELLTTLRDAMRNVVHDSAHLMFWFSMDYYAKTRVLLEEMGWSVNPFPLVWVKSDNTGIIPDANRGPRRIYETAFFASRGDRKVVQAVANATMAPGREKSLHMNEKPVSMLQHFMRMIVDETTSILDPTAGSANALKAARKLGATTLLGLERDIEFYTIAKESFNDEV